MDIISDLQWRRIREAWQVFAKRFNCTSGFTLGVDINSNTEQVRYSLRYHDETQTFAMPLYEFNFDARNHQRHRDFLRQFEFTADKMFTAFQS